MLTLGKLQTSVQTNVVVNVLIVKAIHKTDPRAVIIPFALCTQDTLSTSSRALQSILFPKKQSKHAIKAKTLRLTRGSLRCHESGVLTRTRCPLRAGPKK